MSNLLSDLLGQTITIQTTSTVYPSLRGGYFILYGPHPRLVNKPVISFSHRITGQLFFHPEADKFILLDKAGAPIFNVSDVLDRDNPDTDIISPVKQEIINRLDEDNIMPFVHRCLKNGLKHIRKQFKEIKKEIKPWLQQKYHLNPKADGFIDWYVKTKLTPFLNANPIVMAYVKYFAGNEMVATVDGEIHFQPDSMPNITHQDIQEYCLFFHQGLEAKNQSLQKMLAPSLKALPPSPSGGNIHIEIPPRTFKWQGPINDQLNQLDDLYHLLNGPYLQGSISAFRGVFGYGPFLGPVRWVATDSALIWLLLELQRHDFLPSTSRQNWGMVAALFVGINKTYSPNSLKAVKANLRNTLGKRLKEEISAIVTSLSD